MSNAKRIKPSTYAIAMMMRKYIMPATGAYETVKSTTSSMDDTYAHVMGYRSYLFSMSVVFTLKCILERSIFVSGGIKELRNGVLNVVDFSIFSSFEIIESYQSDWMGTLDYITNMIWYWSFL